ncbi:MAG: hypothetical protein JO019_00700 [Candidatus Kaiserbacteria bacterium]|nr:hypothetical protein [Candidatus Kaiserbacteria bacterium]
MYKRFLTAIPALAALALPVAASAHEVYVLTPDEIAYGVHTPAFNMLSVIFHDMRQFLFWAMIAVIFVSTVFAISISRRIERALDPFLLKIKRYAHPTARITISLGLFASAYYDALFGPELPLSAVFGSAVVFVRVLIVLIALAFLINRFTRTAALVAAVIFAGAIFEKGIYIFTYTNYLGEFIALLIGAHTATHAKSWFDGIAHRLAPYAFPILRMCFGFSLLDASIYAKVLHNNLALQVASLPLAGHAHSLAYYLGFEPHFLVLGAAIVEIVAGVFFFIGFEIRHTALFLEFWLMLSLFYFGEAIWPHLILIGVPIALLMHGYDRYSIEGWFFKTPRREPVL